MNKISSLHEDIMVPKATAHLGEYKDFPTRFDPKEKSVITRLEQFGADLGAIENVLGKKVSELTWQEYIDIIAGSICARYDVIVASVFDRYTFPSPESPEDRERLAKMTEIFRHFEAMDAKSGISVIRRKNDIGKEDTSVVLGLEAGANLIKSMGDIKSLVAKGIKLFGLQYSADSPLATNEGGLTELGRSVVDYLFGSNLIVDLAHASYKTRQDVIAIAKEKGYGHLVSYTHGSTESDVLDSWKNKAGERALKQKEVEQIISMGGIIGLGVTKPFFGSVREVAERIKSIADIGGIDNVAIGTDFGGVPPNFLNEIGSPDDFKKLGDVLSEEFDVNDKDIDKVLRSNAKEWIKGAID